MPVAAECSAVHSYSGCSAVQIWWEPEGMGPTRVCRSSDRRRARSRPGGDVIAPPGLGPDTEAARAAAKR